MPAAQVERSQKYARQFTREDGAWRLWPVDPANSETERARWQVPTIAEAEAQARAMNRANRQRSWP